MAESPGDKELSFERAEVAGDAASAAPSSSAVCALCSTPIRDVYFQVGGAIACAPCRARVVAEREGGSAPGRFGRAALFGVGAAIVGALLWFGVARLTGYEFSLIAIVIGYLVGNAVRLGARRRGGWLYQALAILLTYTSIISTYIPAIYEAATGQSEGSVGGAEVSLFGLAVLLAIAFAAPFLGGFSNFMGWIILAIGLYEAWKINRREELAIEGPFRVAGAPPAYVPEIPPPPIAP